MREPIGNGESHRNTKRKDKKERKEMTRTREKIKKHNEHFRTSNAPLKISGCATASKITLYDKTVKIVSIFLV